MCDFLTLGIPVIILLVCVYQLGVIHGRKKALNEIGATNE